MLLFIFGMLASAIAIWFFTVGTFVFVHEFLIFPRPVPSSFDGSLVMILLGVSGLLFWAGLFLSRRGELPRLYKTDTNEKLAWLFKPVSLRSLLKSFMVISVGCLIAIIGRHAYFQCAPDESNFDPVSNIINKLYLRGFAMSQYWQHWIYTKN